MNTEDKLPINITWALTVVALALLALSAYGCHECQKTSRVMAEKGIVNKTTTTIFTAP